METIELALYELYAIWFDYRMEHTGGTEDDIVDYGAPTPPFRRADPKVGRNDPCPCGSGRKFKKCCGAGGDATLH